MERKREIRKGSRGTAAKSAGAVTLIPSVVWHLLALCTVLFAGLFCYANSYSVPFVLDDVTSILTNPLVKSFDFRLKSRILGDLSFALNYRLGGFEPCGYHVVNLILHLLNAGFVYLLVQLIFRTPLMKGSNADEESGQVPSAPVIIGFGAALIFVCHPLQTQAVTYIAQRVALLAAFFYLGALLCYAASRLSNKRLPAAILLGVSLLLAVAGVLAKENAVTIPLAILLFEMFFFRGELRSRLLPIAWYLLPLAAAPLVMLGRIGLSFDLLGEVGRLTAESSAPSRMTYLLTQFPVIVSYLRLFLLPAGQNLDHDVPLRTTPADPVVLGAFILLAALAAFGYRLWQQARKMPADYVLKALPAFGIAWFFITLLVESSVIPIRDVMFEHRLYLPSVGLSLVVSAGVWQVAAWWRGYDIRRSAAVFMLLFVIIGVSLGTATFLRNRVWQSEVTLWQDVVGKSPGKARAFGSLGHAQQRAGNADEAIRSYRQAVQLAPADHIARNNLGTIYLVKNRPLEALEQFNEALKSKPSSFATHYNLGLALAKLERLDEAAASYREAIRLGGNGDQVLNNLGIVLFRQGRVREALAAFRESVKLNPENAEAAGNLAAVEKTLK
jgi:Flp pilus assembly protein TadD